MSFNRVLDFVITEFLPGQDPADMSPDQPLISSGVVDSVGVMKLVLFLEQTFDIELDPEDIAGNQLDTLGGIVALVESKRLRGAASLD